MSTEKFDSLIYIVQSALRGESLSKRDRLFLEIFEQLMMEKVNVTLIMSKLTILMEKEDGAPAAVADIYNRLNIDGRFA